MDYIKLKNFKTFKEEAEFELAPITILTGKNNSGKSSLLKAILLLGDFLDSENQTLLSFSTQNQHKHKINKFKNAKNWDNDSKQIEITYQKNRLIVHLTFDGMDDQDYMLLKEYQLTNPDIGESLLLQRLSESKYQLTVSQKFINAIVFSGRRRVIETKDLEDQLAGLRDEKKAIRNQLANKELPPDNYQKLISEQQQIDQQIKLIQEQLKEMNESREKNNLIYNPEIDLEEIDYPFLSIPQLVRSHLLNYIQSDKRENRFFSSRDVRFSMLRLSDFIQMETNFEALHLSPNRTHQSRLYFRSNNFSEINQIINQYAWSDIKSGREADRFLKKWLKIFEIGDDIRVKSVEGSASSLEVKNSGRWINLADKGFGAGQILTILLLITNTIHNLQKGARRRIFGRPVILIEEPESNLHPFLQSKLAELFYDAYQNFKITFILESHSEYMIRKTQAIINKTRNMSAFKVYYFDGAEGTREMRYREDGKFIDEFGPGFFDEASNLAFEIL